ncbi:MAG: PadR family transcriptional regulator [Candidatus Hodarchaeales archaeon]
MSRQETSSATHITSVLAGNESPLVPLPVAKILFLTLLKKHPNSTGYDLIQKGTKFVKNEIKIKSGSIYPILREFEELGLVTSIQQESGRKRRVYVLTKEGEKELIALGKILKFRVNLLINPLLEIIEKI